MLRRTARQLVVVLAASTFLLGGCGGTADSTEIATTEVAITHAVKLAYSVGVATHEWQGASGYAPLDSPLLAARFSDGTLITATVSPELLEEIGAEGWETSDERMTWTSDLPEEQSYLIFEAPIPRSVIIEEFRPGEWAATGEL